VILPREIEELQAYGIERIYSPDDGRRMGLQGMIDDMLARCDFPIDGADSVAAPSIDDHHSIARALTRVENQGEGAADWLASLHKPTRPAPVLGITGTGGAGKSSIIDELTRRFLVDFPDKRLAILSVDPSKRKTGGALLGDRIRMNSIHDERVYMRSLATRQANLALAGCIREALTVLRSAGFDLILLETSGIGQSDTEIVDFADVSLYVMTPEYGAASQLEKIDMLDFADVVALNKFDRRGAMDALRDVRKQWKRAHKEFELPDEAVPVVGTMASQFNDPGTNLLYRRVFDAIERKCRSGLVSHLDLPQAMAEKIHVIPPRRVRYLAEIAEANRGYDRWVREQAAIARRLHHLQGTLDALRDADANANEETIATVERLATETRERLDPNCRRILDTWDERVASFRGEFFTYKVRGRDVQVRQQYTTLSGTRIQKVAFPNFADWGERIRWTLTENVPGRFPYAAGVFPFKREQGTRRACSPVRAGPSGRTSASTTSRTGNRRSGCRRPSTR
jgi:methylmalonyl-CoA mutase